MAAPAPAEFVPPKITRKFSMAAAGHEGVMRDDSGALVIKPALPKEIAFYQSLPDHPEFAKWAPSFMGTLQLAADDDGKGPDVSGTATPILKTGASGSEASIVLSNAAYGFTRACVMDVKLGAQLWDDAAPQEKRDRLDEVSRKTTSSSMGFRIAGMKVWNGEDYQVYDKMYGRTFTADNVVEGFREFYGSGGISKEQRELVVERHLRKVEEIRAVVEGQESRMYSASLLFVYEGDGKSLDEALEIERKEAAKAKEKAKKGDADDDDDDDDDDDEDDDDDDQEIRKVEELKVIDFAHADWTPGQGLDKNFLQGVYSVVDLLKKCM